MRRSVWVATTAALALLTGCAGQPAEFHRYTLPSGETQLRATQAATHTLAVAPVRLAAFLADAGLVYQNSDIEVQQAQGHLWADDLDHQLERQLRSELTRRLPAYRVLPSGARDDVDMLLAVSVDKFQGRYDGQAVIAGQYQLRDERDRLLAAEPFQIEQPLAEDGYPALVHALAAGWTQAADRMAAAVVRHTGQASASAADDDDADANLDVDIER